MGPMRRWLASTPSRTSSWPVWVGRVGEPQPKADYSDLTPSQRIALCWEATKQAWAITGAKRAAGRLKDLADLEELGCSSIEWLGATKIPH
jgi:uncharacterized protein YndB with AHSA1/START domain